MTQPRLGRDLIGVGSDTARPAPTGWTPSPGPRRLEKAPSRATLSPKGERVGFSDGH